jgi:hypothetical protein
MSNLSLAGIQVLDLLKGVWSGEGRGYFPGVTSFDYRETLTFTRHDAKVLAYEQRTQKRYDGGTEWLESHWENGQRSNRSRGGVDGNIESLDALFRIHFVTQISEVLLFVSL